MRTHTNVREMIDLITEEVAYKSGVLLNDYQMKGLLKSRELEPWLKVFSKKQDLDVYVRPEFIEDCITMLRYRLGNIPEAIATPAILTRGIMSLYNNDEPLEPIIQSFGDLIHSEETKVIDSFFARKLAEKANVKLKSVERFLGVLADYQDKSLLWGQVKPTEWDGVLPLSDLFEVENIPSDPGSFLDQRFLDYLGRNPYDLERIHWRNFERFTAEFFNKQGYEVKLGPGSKDGGVDIRIWPKERRRNGPPFLIIQCKRLKGGKTVKVEYVKAFWADVVYEGAKKGLIATTARVAPDGKRINQARNWPLSFAESEQVRKWAQTMWRVGDFEIKVPKGIGRYILPPIYY